MSIKHNNPLVEHVGHEIADRLADIEGYFKPGVKLTLLVRRPGLPEQDVCVTNDNFDDMLAMIQRRKDAES